MSMHNNLSVLMIFMDEPYLALYVKELYKRFWKDEVGELLIFLNCNLSEVANFIESIWDQENKVFVIKKSQDIPHYLLHGGCLNLLYPHITKKYFLILDSDNFIYQKGIISKMVSEMENTNLDVVGIENNAASRLIIEAAKARFQTVGLSPRFCFFRKSLVDKVPDIDFSAKSWPKGTYLKPIDYTVPDTFPSDYAIDFDCAETLVWLAMQVFTLTTKIRFIPLDEPGRYHVGSFSSVSYHFDKRNRPEAFKSLNFLSNAIRWNYDIFQMMRGSCPLEDFNKNVEQFLLELVRLYNINVNYPINHFI